MVKAVDIQDNLSKAPLVAREQHVIQTAPETTQRQLAQVSAQEQILDHSRVLPTEQEEPAEMRVYDREKNARRQGRQNAREDVEEEASARPAAATSDRTEEEHHHIDVTI